MNHKLCVFLISLALFVKGRYADNPPHIVFILSDDLGWSDVSYHGSKQVPTPNIDALALDGIILNNYYVQPSCSPSRAALMTGRYPFRYGMREDVILSSTPWGLPLDEKLFPQYLKPLNYATHAVGKWNLGHFEKEYLPMNRGFDSFFGYWNAVEDYFTHVCIEIGTGYAGYDFHDNYDTVWEYAGVYGPDVFTNKSVEIIRNHNTEQPLFLYVPHQAPHSGNKWTIPNEAPAKYVDPLVGIDDPKRRTYGGMLSSLDFTVGAIVEALEEAGMLDNTIIVFSSDNGTPVDGYDGTMGSNFPMRGGKGTKWEGGVRGAGFIWSSILRKNPRVSNGMMHITDWLPTLLSAAGVDNTSFSGIDGINMWDHFIDKTPSPRENILIYIEDRNGSQAYRMDDFMLVRELFDSQNVWSDINGITINSTIPVQSDEVLEMYENNYGVFLNNSKAANILQRKYGRSLEENLKCTNPGCDTLVSASRCGMTPGANLQDLIVSECLIGEYCLFNVSADPCELNNVAHQYPDIVKQMKEAIENYRPYVLPTSTRPSDPEANPILHGNVWDPWQTSA